jgi:hypothetical protein
MEVEQMMVCLLEEIRKNRAKKDAEQAKTDATLKRIKEEMPAKLDAHHESMMARMNSQLMKMKACLGKTEAMDLEANPEETESEVEHEEVPKEEVAVESTEEEAWGPESSHRAPRSVKEMDPGQWWVPEEVGCCSQADDTLCRAARRKRRVHIGPMIEQRRWKNRTRDTIARRILY